MIIPLHSINDYSIPFPYKLPNGALGNHKILFVFDNKPNADRVFLSEPWSFDKYLVVMQRYKKNTHIANLKFDKQPFGCKSTTSLLGI